MFAKNREKSWHYTRVQDIPRGSSDLLPQFMVYEQLVIEAKRISSRVASHSYFAPHPPEAQPGMLSASRCCWILPNRLLIPLSPKSLGLYFHLFVLTLYTPPVLWWEDWSYRWVKKRVTTMKIDLKLEINKVQRHYNWLIKAKTALKKAIIAPKKPTFFFSTTSPRDKEQILNKPFTKYGMKKKWRWKVKKIVILSQCMRVILAQGPC